MEEKNIIKKIEITAEANTAAVISVKTKLGSLLLPAYNAAPDFFSGISGWLGGKIVPLGMDDDGFSYDIFDGETLVVKGRPGITLVSEQGNHVAGMFRVESVGRVKMAAGFFKRTGAVAVLVDVHGIKIGRILRGNIGKPEYFRFYKDAFIRGTVKLDKAAQFGVCAFSCNPCHSGRTVFV